MAPSLLDQSILTFATNMLREMWLDGKIKLEYCPTERMLADILTKSLDFRRFSIIRGQMGLKA